MSISKELFLAILSMDSYNRGYGAGLADGGEDDPDGLGISGVVGYARIRAHPNEIDLNDWETAGFYALAYEMQTGEQIDGLSAADIVISYRGTNASPFEEMWKDIVNGWTMGGGFTHDSQPGMAIAFYQPVTGQSVYGPPAANTYLTGHPLGGGLAGFVSALSGTADVGFDRMPFGVAAARPLAIERSQQPHVRSVGAASHWSRLTRLPGPRFAQAGSSPQPAVSATLRTMRSPSCGFEQPVAA